MRSFHSRNTVRYYILILAFLSFLFFSNDFGLIDVQKTAIVMAVGIDREENQFIVTSQIAVPKSSDQGNASEAVQLVSRGKTVAEAFEQINAKTGWYPKLVFCNLIVLGKKTAEENVFDALDFFLREEYLTDDCQIAVCDGQAKEILNTAALVDPSSSVAVQKVLSEHAKRVGTVLPANLKDFAIGYFGAAQSGTLPVLKPQPQQEQIPPQDNAPQDSSSTESASEGESSSTQSSAEEESSSAGEGGSSQGGGSSGGEKSGGKEDKPVFSARETALFVRGKWVETLTADETFAVNAAIGKLRLANYSVAVDENACTLIIKRNLSSLRLDLGKEGRGVLKIRLKIVAGAIDYSKAQPVEKIKDFGEVPEGAFDAAEKKLAATLSTAYEKARAVGCDVFGLQERLVKYKKRAFFDKKDTLLEDTPLSVEVTFGNLR